nr:hypothetical protein [Nonomuraea aurantiaca]
MIVRGVTRASEVATTSPKSAPGPKAIRALPVAVQCSGMRPAMRDGLDTWP